MKTCNKCNIKIDTSYSYCPLCHQTLEGDIRENHVELFPTKDIRDHISHNAQRLIFFFTLLSIIILGTLNVLYSSVGFWSLIPIGATVYLWLLLRYVILTKTSSIGRITLTTFFLTTLVVIINLRYSSDLWSLDYVFPSLMIANNTTIFIILLAKTEGFKYNVFHMLFLVLVSLTPLVFYYIGFVEEPLLSFIAFSHGLLILLHLLVFHSSVLKELLKRIFHL